MEAALLTIEVTPEDLSKLARGRAEMVRDELVGSRNLAAGRVLVSAARPESTPKRQAELQLE